MLSQSHNSFTNLMNDIKTLIMQYIIAIMTIISYNPNEGNDMKNIKMKMARVESDLSQQQLADKICVSRQTIGLIEAGKYNPSLNLCISICKALSKTLNDLFWEE
jgi:putative transcriptional regulator